MPLSSADVALVLRRAGFGGTRQQINELTGLERTQVVDRVLDLSAPYAGPAPPDMANGSVAAYDRFVALQQWWLDRMARTTTPVVEKMTLFWHGLFTTSFQKVYNPPMIAAQHHFYRANCLGDLRTLVQGMCTQPAMLDYLDNAWSRKSAPNQNFARELLELFLLGAGTFTEDDVNAAAAAWTGHSIDTATNAYQWQAGWHDTGSKTFMGRTGAWDGPDIIEIILTDPAVAPVMGRWIARKLWEFFAHPGPPPAAVDAIAAALVPSLDIEAAVRTLFLRDEFYAPASVQGHVRSPIEYVVAVLRGLPNARAIDLHPEWYLDDMGQVPFAPPTVEGWKQNGAWVSTSGAGAKARFAEYARWNLAGGPGNAGSGKQPLLGCVGLGVDAAVQLALETFHITAPSAATTNVLRSWLTTRRSHNGQGWWEPGALFMLVLLCPELQVG